MGERDREREVSVVDRERQTKEDGRTARRGKAGVK